MPDLHIIVNLSNVLESWDGLDGIDEVASNKAYAAEMKRRIRVQYPRAAVRVNCRHALSGFGDQISVNGLAGHLYQGVMATIHWIMLEMMYERDQWVIRS